MIRSSIAFSIKLKVSRFTLNLPLDCSFVQLWYRCCQHRQSLCSTGPFSFRSSFVDEQTTAAAIFWIEFSSSNKIFRALEPSSLLLNYSMLSWAFRFLVVDKRFWANMMAAMFCSSQHIWPDRPKLFLSYCVLQFTSVATLRRFSVLDFILDGILSDGIPSVTSFSSSNMNSANIGATRWRSTI